MSVATECVPEIELPTGFVPSPSARPVAPRRFSVIPGHASPVRPGVLPAGARPALLVRPLASPIGRGEPRALVEGFPTHALPAVPGVPAVPAGPAVDPVRPGAPARPAALPGGHVGGQGRVGATDRSAAVRLTRRGRLAATVGVLALAVTFVWLAWLGAPRDAATSAPARVPATVVVHPGDTLWSLARHYAPQRDPRAVVDTLMRLNHLDSGTVTPGQVLRLH